MGGLIVKYGLKHPQVLKANLHQFAYQSWSNLIVGFDCDFQTIGKCFCVVSAFRRKAEQFKSKL